MDKKAATLDLFLTEVSFELLGNKMYDINGTQQSSLMGLFKSVDTESLDSNENDLLKSIGFPTSLSTLNETSCKDLLDKQFTYMLSQQRQRHNRSAIDARIKLITEDKAKFYGATTEHQIKKGAGKSFIEILNS